MSRAALGGKRPEAYSIWHGSVTRGCAKTPCQRHGDYTHEFQAQQCPTNLAVGQLKHQFHSWQNPNRPTRGKSQAAITQTSAGVGTQGKPGGEEAAPAAAAAAAAAGGAAQAPAPAPAPAPAGGAGPPAGWVAGQVCPALPTYDVEVESIVSTRARTSSCEASRRSRASLTWT